MSLDGRILDDRYHVERSIGSGTQSEVYRGHDMLLDRTVAIKLLTNSNPSRRSRFMAEARAMAVLNHPHIVAIYDFGEIDEFSYIIMEYVDGKILRDALQARELNIERLFVVFESICSALEAAHERSIIHRDLKPANVLLGKNGEVKVTDFGLARRMSDVLPDPESPEVAGTVAYLPPECFLGKAMDARGDLYSVGILMYEAFTGSLPFVVGANDMIAMVFAHVNDVPVPPRALNRQMPTALERIILKLIQKDPDDRYQSAREVRELLAQIEPKMLEVGEMPSRRTLVQHPKPEEMDPGMRSLLDSMLSPQRSTKEALGRVVSGMLAANRRQYHQATELYSAAIEEFKTLKNDAEFLKASLHLGECLLQAAADETVEFDLQAVMRARVYLAEAGAYAHSKGLRREFEQCRLLANALESRQIKRSSIS
jgi:serine/threonine protein kinase